MHRLFARRSPGERVIMACEMFDLARALIVANVTAETPETSAAERRVRLFERLYADDVEPASRERIVARFRRVKRVPRKQYYFRPAARGLLAWDVDRLIELSARLPRFRVPLASIRELDEA